MKQDTKIKVLMTAGHAATTAFSLYEMIKKERKNWDVVWIGTKKAIEGRDATTLEHKIFSNLGINSFFIASGRLQRRLSIWTIPSLFKIPVGFIQSLLILGRERPDIIVSFGGHVSVPVCLAGHMLGIPVIVHEQTAAAGLANRIVARFARKVAISRDSSRPYFPAEKIELTGNLVRTEFLDIKHKKTIGQPPMIYITGGSRGSQTLNNAISDSLETILKSYTVVHQTGDTDYKRFLDFKGTLHGNLSKHYSVVSVLGTTEVVRIFEAADIIIGRAGANTVSEIIVARKPSILIPIPWVQNNEQNKNAAIAESIGLSIVINENELNADLLMEKIDFIRKNWKKFATGSSNQIADLDRSASRKLLNIIEDLVK